ncbi:DNA internalization-related competence protein ComEC/Rec2 [Pandoraea sp. XJJ-1]|uniref:DNA internalization-related competence protein ComEC/Rec2 n=1 Tax=Pandoraea sp. XJJ-1 TaxID=3002643 RepID=UPI0022823A2B|nr:DNA internalization-related competence protein ComEC/Rec2 [Pandoraea sp. XJJ-1]WAL84418.1 DNA internalization-related competence protein ComEC/Rec2 [Pandoraea sp. XJJ-1]
MRLVLLAWVAGVWWLQQASVLPQGRAFGAALGVAAGVFALWAVWATRGVVGRDRGAARASLTTRDGGARFARSGAHAGERWRHRSVVAVLALCAGVFGYSWAALRAEARLNDRLPVELEGRDLMVVGVVAGLPAPTDDGQRFAFDAERAYVLDERCEMPVSATVRSMSDMRGDRSDADTRAALCREVRVPKAIELVWPGRSRFGGKWGPGGAVAGSPHAGERWRLPVRLKAPRGFANWHGADAELTALVRGIRATGYVRALSGRGEATRTKGSLRLQAETVPGYRFVAWREQLRDKLRAGLGPSARYGGVLIALALGERGDIAADDWQVFADTGVSHLLAISGLHVSLVAGVLATLVGTLWRRACTRRFSLPLWWPAPKAAAVSGLLAAVAYGAVAGWGVPVRRAVGMVAILVFALLNGRMAAPSYVLAWALATVVALDPWAVVTPGLWLSFGAVAALVLGAGRTQTLRAARRRGIPEGAWSPSTASTRGHALADVRRPGESQDVRRHGGDRQGDERRAGDCRGWDGRRQAGKRRGADRQDADPQEGAIRRWPAAALARLGPAARAQYAVTIGLVPLTLAWFGSVPLLGPLANAIAIPVMTLIVTPLALASLMLPATMAHWALAVAHAVVVWLADWLGMLAAWPWAVWRAAVAPAWAQAAAVGGVLLCLMPWPAAMRRLRVWRVGVRIAGFALLGPALLASSPRPGTGEFRVTLLDIGQGNAVLVETASRTLLFDAGPPLGRHSDAGRRVIVPYLRAHGIRRLDRLVISHAHDDHFGGALSVLRAYPSAQVLSSLPATHGVRSAAAAHRTCLAGQQWMWDGVTFRFLHPDKGALREGWAGRVGPNSVSCVLRVSNAQHSALLAADAEAPQERAMLARFGAGLRSDVLLAPHHGSLTSSTAVFIEAVSPAHVVFQAGYRNRFGHPRPEVVARYQAAGVRIWQSVTHGGVRFSFTKDGIEAQSYREQYRRYWHAEVPDTS